MEVWSDTHGNLLRKCFLEFRVVLDTCHVLVGQRNIDGIPSPIKFLRFRIKNAVELHDDSIWMQLVREMIVRESAVFRQPHFVCAELEQSRVDEFRMMEGDMSIFRRVWA